MAYDFSMPIIQGLLARRALEEQAATEEPKPLLSLLSNPEQTAPVEQPQQQSSPQPQEPLDGKQMIDVSMAKALDIPQAPNSYALDVQRGLLAQKQAYADAKTDAEKAIAHSTAEILRNKANAVGIDVSGYGSDVSLGDAVNNLASQEARDIMGALQGYYSRDSGQYYNDEYWRGIERGLSPRKAQKVAEALTGSYKADRVNYLDGLLNSYGRADTALANQILASMIPEAPALAQFYSLTNPSPLNEYNTAVDVAKQLANNGYQINLIQETGKQTRQSQDNAAEHNKEQMTLQAVLNKDTYAANKAVDFYYGEQGKNNDVFRNVAEYESKATIEADKLIKVAREQTNLDFSRFRWEKNFLQALENSKPSEIKKLYNMWAEYGTMKGLKGEELNRFAVDGVGFNLARSMEGKSSGKDNSSPNSIKLNELISLRNSYVNHLDKLTKADPLNPVEPDEATLKEIEQVKKLLALVDEDITRMTGTTNAQFNFQGREHEREDLALINDIWAENKDKYTDEQIKQGIYKMVKSATGDEEYARRLAGFGMN